jgi:hypothetical protein
LVIFEHIVPPSPGSKLEKTAVAQLLELPKNGGCGVNAKGPAVHADSFLNYTMEGGNASGIFGNT